MKKILILATGGTIASGESEGGLAPNITVEHMLEYCPTVKDSAHIDCETILNLDSSNIQPEEWQVIAQAVAAAKDRYDGIVITHGTDTMAYTASILTFMLMGIDIPVILTGSQLPINVEGSDGPKNLSDAIAAAASKLSGGIYIVFNGKIILGCRTTKFRTVDFNAFESINADYVGYVADNQVTLNENFPFPKIRPRAISFDVDNNVFLLKLIPGTSTRIFDFIREAGYKGIVIEAFGIGGLHYIHRDLPGEIKKLIQSGITVVIVSQCPLEPTDLSLYEVGKRVETEGVISGRDMTSEAAVTKLMWALANAGDKSVREIMLENFCGEIAE